MANMLVHLKLVLLCAIIVAVMAMSAADAARQLLDDYDICRRNWRDWRDRDGRGDFYCDGRRWDRDGRYYYRDRYYGPGDRGGFEINIGGK